jgi:hypothetical protein
MTRDRHAALRLTRGADRLEERRVLLEREKLVVRHRPERVLIAREDRHDRLDPRQGKFSRRQAADEPEHRAVAADPERDGQQQGERQRRGPAERPHGRHEVRQ